MKEKTCLVTGASSGLGFALAKGLAMTGATIVMVCRDPEKGQKARLDIIKASGNPNIDLLPADLSNMRQVTRLAARFKARYEQLDLLANIAGTRYPYREKTIEGHEINFATNILGPFLLTELLLDVLLNSQPATILNVSGEDHRYGRIHWDDFNLSTNYRPNEANRQTALARVMWTYELAHRLKGTMVTANTFSPGRTYTQLHRHLPFFARTAYDCWARLYAQQPEQAIDPVLQFVLTQAFKGVSGAYMEEGQIMRSVPLTYYRGASKRLWRTLERKLRIEHHARELIRRAKAM